MVSLSVIVYTLFIFMEVSVMAKFEREVDIDSKVEKVWEVLTNTAYWPQWFPGIDSIANVSAVQKGGTFEWVDDGRTGNGEFLEVLPQKKLVVLTQMGRDKDKHTFELRPTGGFFGLAADECKVKYKLDTLTGAGILGNFITGGNPKDALRVKKAAGALRKLVESL